MLASLLEPIFEAVAYGTGALLVRLFSFGKIDVNWDENVKFPWYGFSRSKNKKLQMMPEYAGLLGVSFWICIAVLVFMFFKK